MQIVWLSDCSFRSTHSIVRPCSSSQPTGHTESILLGTSNNSPSAKSMRFDLLRRAYVSHIKSPPAPQSRVLLGRFGGKGPVRSLLRFSTWVSVKVFESVSTRFSPTHTNSWKSLVKRVISTLQVKVKTAQVFCGQLKKGNHTNSHLSSWFSSNLGLLGQQILLLDKPCNFWSCPRYPALKHLLGGLALCATQTTL